MANSADPDQLASSEANWSGSTLFAKAGYIWVQQDKDLTQNLNQTVYLFQSKSNISYKISILNVKILVNFFFFFWNILLNLFDL